MATTVNDTDTNTNSDKQISKEQYFRQRAEELQALKTRAAKIDIQVSQNFESCSFLVLFFAFLTSSGHFSLSFVQRYANMMRHVKLCQIYLQNVALLG